MSDKESQINDLLERVRNYDRVIQAVATALGGVCCGGIDVDGPGSTKAVLVEAIEKLKIGGATGGQTMRWFALTKDTKPRAGSRLVIIWKGEPHYAVAKRSTEYGDRGIWIKCLTACATWNVDHDEPDSLPSHFIVLPPLPKTKP